MRQLYAAELRDSWTAWLGVTLAFIATNFALALPALVELIGVRAVLSGEMNVWNSAAYTIGPGLNIIYCIIVGAVVIGSSTALVIDSRRGSLARLSLAGATPGQVTGSIMLQLTAVTIGCAVVADLLAFALLQPTLVFLNEDPSLNLSVPQATLTLWPVLAANLLAIGVALIGGLRQASLAARIPPVEALRQATSGLRERMTVPRWIAFVLAGLVIVAVFATIPLVVDSEPKEVFSNVMNSAMLLLVLSAGALAMIAPLLVGPLTRLWTAAVPSRDPIWRMSRTTAVVKASRLVKSVVPVMMTVGLLFGLLLLTDVMLGTFRSLGYGVELSGTSAATMLSFLGLPLLVALSGGVGSLIMMSKQRDAELALSGIVGTTPAQRVALPVLEALIITVTGTLLAIGMVAIPVAYLAFALPAANFPFVLDPSWSVLALSFAACLAVTVSATVLPTLPSLRKPEPRVIARLVAE